MVCGGLETITDMTLTGILKYPLTCDYYFYLKIIAGLFIIISATLFFEERKRVGRGDILSAMGISSIAIIFIALLGSIIGILTAELFIITLVVCIVFIVIWILS
jgi:uncharacterized membrane protein